MIFISPYVKKALCFAAQKHDGQYRKGDSIPYIVHPIQVAFGVSKYTNDQEIIAAALLHDVLEDCVNVSVHLLRKEFGNRTALMVNELSYKKTKKKKTWKERKKIYLSKIKRASKDALIIVAVDKMCNLELYIDILKKENNIISLFKGTPSEYFWYYKKIEEILKSKFGSGSRIVKDYNKILKLLEKENL
ncbi:MAG: HD domain-containing protein [Candidatus Nomurabacteria bacterium]|nr:HD domain-containing protein [Candidatus Nomurabacteria bacterium]